MKPEKSEYMKKLLFVLIILMFLRVDSFGADSEYIENEIKSSGIYNVYDNFSNTSKQSIEKIYPYFDFNEIVKNVSKGNVAFDFKYFLNKIIELFFGEIKNNFGIMLSLIAITFLCSILNLFIDEKNKNGVEKVAFFAFFGLVAGIIFQVFINSVSEILGIIESIVTFIKSFMPILITFLATSGSIISASMLQPFLMLLISVLSMTINKLLVPIIFLISAFSVINNLNENMQISSLVLLLKSFVKYLLGTILIVFLGVLSVCGFVTSTVDGVSIKTAKYAIGAFVPMVGGILSDSVEMVVSSSLIIKNAIGVAGLVALSAAVLMPIIKLLAQILIFKLSAAIIEPVADKKIVAVINDLSGALSMLFSCLLAVFLFVLVAVTILLKAGSMAAMIR